MSWFLCSFTAIFIKYLFKSFRVIEFQFEISNIGMFLILWFYHLVVHAFHKLNNKLDSYFTYLLSGFDSDFHRRPFEV